MRTHQPGRRDFLKLTALGTAGLPFVLADLSSNGLHAAGRGRLGATVAYDPSARFEIAVSEVEFRRIPSGRTLMARVYRPSGPGPFPTMLDLHGGAWDSKDRRGGGGAVGGRARAAAPPLRAQPPHR